MKTNSLRQGVRLLLITPVFASSVNAQNFNFLTNKSVDLRPQIQRVRLPFISATQPKMQVTAERQ